MNQFLKFYFNISLVGCLIFLFGCSKFIEIDSPKNQLTTDKVFTDSVSAISALSNVYFILANNLNSNFNKSLSLYVDEYVYTTQNEEFYAGWVSENNGTNANIWGQFYEVIYSCNDIIERVVDNEGLSETARDMLIGETKFIRAFSYFYLYNLYENIPLILNTDVNENRTSSQADSTTVFNQILDDLEESKGLLSVDYVSGERARINKWSVRAMLSQVYLYLGEWENALRESNEIIESNHYSLENDIEKVFISNSNETIWQLWNLNGYISDASSLIPSSNNELPQYVIANDLLSNYENGDLRKQKWLGINKVVANGDTIDYYFPFKYKNRSAPISIPEYIIVLRLSEQYLIRAEAKLKLEDVKGAIEDLNIIRARASLEPLSIDMDNESVYQALKHERRIEMVGEWAKRFVDLKRWQALNNVMSREKDTWVINVSDKLPIPMNELLYNFNLIQNEGYN